MAQKINMEGMRFGNLLVSGGSETIGGILYWWCKCDCGTVKPVNGQNLRSRGVISCGCARKGPITRKSILKANPNIERKIQKPSDPFESMAAINSSRDVVKSTGLTFGERMDLARSMRKTFTSWISVAELCGDDVVAELRGVKA